MRRSLARELLLLIAGLALAAAGAEAYLRAFAPQERMTPSYVTRYGRLAFQPGVTIRHRAQSGHYDVVYRINSLGFRGPDIPTAALPGVKRAVVLGPSIAFGTGVQDGETYASRLEKLLTAAGPAPFQVVNMGGANMPLTLYPVIYNRYAAPYSPALLIVQIQADVLPSLIDAGDGPAQVEWTPLTRWQSLRLRLRRNPLYVWLCENSNLWALRRMEMAKRLKLKGMDDAAAPAKAAEIQRLAAAGLDSLFAEFCAPGRRALVLYDPADMSRYPALAEYLGRSERCRRPVAFPVDPARDVFGPDELHWTPATHARAAARLAAALQNWK